MVVCGLDDANNLNKIDNAERVANFAILAQHFSSKICISNESNKKVELRMGINTGSCVSGVVGHIILLLIIIILLLPIIIIIIITRERDLYIYGYV